MFWIVLSVLYGFGLVVSLLLKDWHINSNKPQNDLESEDFTKTPAVFGFFAGIPLVILSLIFTFRTVFSMYPFRLSKHKACDRVL